MRGVCERVGVMRTGTTGQGGAGKEKPAAGRVRGMGGGSVG